MISVVLLAVSVLTWPFFLGPQLVVVVLAAMMAEAAAIALPGGGTQSLSYPLSLSALVLFGPTAGAVVAAVSAIQLRRLKEGPRERILAVFNGGQVLIATVLSGFLYAALGGRFLIELGESGTVVKQFSAADFPWVILPLVVLALTSYVLNALMATVGLSALHHVPLRSIWSRGVVALVPSQIALAFLGYGMAQVVTVSSLGFILFVIPLIISRQLFQNYLALREAYMDSVIALVAAIEAKDRYTSGHSRRVASYALSIGRGLSLKDDVLERLERAALLHDLGKVAVSNRILNKCGPLTPSERSAIHEHPALGGSIASGVPYLSDLANIISGHHERFDGKGYSQGLSGDEIPFESRILAVADAFDAMTSVRAYRDALPVEVAIQEIVVGSGTQFDPAVVDAFVALADCLAVARDSDEQVAG